MLMALCWCPPVAARLPTLLTLDVERLLFTSVTGCFGSEGDLPSVEFSIGHRNERCRSAQKAVLTGSVVGTDD